MVLSPEARNRIKVYVSKWHSHDNTGHDTSHVQRVVANTRVIAESEGADLEKSELAAWLHDIDDPKLTADQAEARKSRNNMLRRLGFSEERITDTEKIIASVSFSNGENVVSLEQKVVQDADRLDAIGAIGIARAFSYGAANGQSMDETLRHFEEKLLRVKALLWTDAAKKEAVKRHQFMKAYLMRLDEEMNFGEGEFRL
ncbi:HD domain-containing protein [Salimicrobium halophilum]|uniref:HD/PDEase domain-containing protein n=1 Tax=Salimicrobium halophilum TaxID=86666 RepID=A0A1G8Q2R7_9BACI|nr:HD domain-containing protein [Salimicrobium halophilum]SDI99054.1 uncharacterized protein SAMN04490247_0364 [Salimicrobium halophilum]